MLELSKHIGPSIDVPAGDIGVGAREIGYLFGEYKRLKKYDTGVLTGKPLDFWGSKIRTEATGYGLVYYVKHLLNEEKDSFNQKNSFCFRKRECSHLCNRKSARARRESCYMFRF